MKLELSRVVKFIKDIGTPHSNYPIIHIAGTNGKGSTAAMLGSILCAYGYKTGLFTSPHLLRPNERIRIGNTMVPDQFIIDKVTEWKPLIEEYGITFFEVLTALGMSYFQEEAVDYAVFETGLGGRLDATNVVDPLISIITSISMDHENILGDTLAKIAGEKAGIIKPYRPVVVSKNTEEVRLLMGEVSEEKHSVHSYVPDNVKFEILGYEGMSQSLKIWVKHKTMTFSMPLIGHHQAENFCNVIVALGQMNLELDPEKIQVGLDTLQWQGRIQSLQTNPLVLFDVAHNSAGLDRLLESLENAGLNNTILISAFNARKNVDALLASLQQWKGPVLYTTFEGHSAVSHDNLLQLGIDESLILDGPEKAYQHALAIKREDQAICFFGSHYLAESLFELFGVEA